MGVPPNGWLTMDTPITMDDLGYPYFRKPPYEHQKWSDKFLRSPAMRKRQYLSSTKCSLEDLQGLPIALGGAGVVSDMILESYQNMKEYY